MRFSFGGVYSVDGFSLTMEQFAEYIRGLGVDKIEHLNIYAKLNGKNQLIKIVDRRGNEIDHMRVETSHATSFATAADLKFKTTSFSRDSTKPIKVSGRAKRKPGSEAT